MVRKLTGARVDPNLCVGSSMCIMHMPGAFRMSDDGHAEFIGLPDDEASLHDVAELCPVSAIKLIYEG